MTVNFYKNSSPNNYVTKDIALTDELDCELKENCDISNPTIEVLGTNALNANYMWVPLFSRYYFITNITTTQYNTLVITAHVDVLMSFHDAILNSTGIISRQENNVVPNLQDNKMPILITKNVQIKRYPNGFNRNPNYALIVSGGYNSFIQ